MLGAAGVGGGVNDSINLGMGERQVDMRMNERTSFLRCSSYGREKGTTACIAEDQMIQVATSLERSPVKKLRLRFWGFGGFGGDCTHHV